jgi:hypothetical protein
VWGGGGGRPPPIMKQKEKNKEFSLDEKKKFYNFYMYHPDISNAHQCNKISL